MTNTDVLKDRQMITEIGISRNKCYIFPISTLTLFRHDIISNFCLVFFNETTVPKTLLCKYMRKSYKDLYLK